MRDCLTTSEGVLRAIGRARELQARLDALVMPVDVYAVADHLGVQIVDAVLEGALAQLIVNGSHARILLSHRVCAPARRRVAIAHELGHYVLAHPSPNAAELCQPRWPHQAIAAGRDIEHEAHSFALELLAPAAEVDALFLRRRPGLSTCARLAAFARIPIEDAAMRIVDRTDSACAAVLSTRAVIAWVAPSRRFRSEFGTSLSSRLCEGASVDPHTLAHGLPGCFASHVRAEVSADWWLGVHGLPLLESSLVLRDGVVLTMLHARHLDQARAPAPSAAC